MLHNLWRNWKGIQWPCFSIVLPIKVFSRFLAMSEVDSGAYMLNAVSVFRRFWHGISVIANFSYGIVVLGTPQCPPSLKITTLPSGPLFEACLHNTTCHHLCRECATRDGEIQATLKQPFYVLLYYLNVFISRLGMIVRVNVVLNRTVVDSGCLPLTTNSRKFLLRCKW